MKKTIKVITALGSATFIANRYLYSKKVHPELINPLVFIPHGTPWPGIMGKIPASQANIMPEAKLVAGTRKKYFTAQSPDNGQTFSAYLVEPEERSEVNGAVLWIHGGGHVIGTAGIDLSTASTIAAELGIPVLSVDYHQSNAGGQFPGDHNECYAALRWLQNQAPELGFSPDKIAVCGNSAGGGLAAGIVQRAADEEYPVAFQGLIYPMLDHATAFRSRKDDAGRGKLIWTHNFNVGAWETYLRDVDRNNLPPYASPAQYKNFAALPATWIGVGDIDLFYEEDKTYYENLKAAGVKTEFSEIPGMYHGADAFKPQAQPAQKLLQDLMRSIREAF